MEIIFVNISWFRPFWKNSKFLSKLESLISNEELTFFKIFTFSLQSTTLSPCQRGRYGLLHSGWPSSGQPGKLFQRVQLPRSVHHLDVLRLRLGRRRLLATHNVLGLVIQVVLERKRRYNRKKNRDDKRERDRGMIVAEFKNWNGDILNYLRVFGDGALICFGW